MQCAPLALSGSPCAHPRFWLELNRHFVQIKREQTLPEATRCPPPSLNDLTGLPRVASHFVPTVKTSSLRANYTPRCM